MAPRTISGAEAVRRACAKAVRKSVDHFNGVLDAPDDLEQTQLTRKDQIAREMVRGYQSQERARMMASRPATQINAVIVPAAAGSIEEWQERRRKRLEAQSVEAIEATPRGVAIEAVSSEGDAESSD